MPSPLSYAEYIVQLAIAADSDNRIARYASVAFLLNGDGLLATCRHIVELCGANEKLFAINPATGHFQPISNVKVHQCYDFAIFSFRSVA